MGIGGLASLKRGGGVQTVGGRWWSERERQAGLPGLRWKANGPPTPNQFRSELFLSRSWCCALPGKGNEQREREREISRRRRIKQLFRGCENFVICRRG